MPSGSSGRFTLEILPTIYFNINVESASVTSPSPFTSALARFIPLGFFPSRYCCIITASPVVIFPLLSASP